MTKTELKKTVVKIKKLLKQRDYGNIDTGIELARGLNEPAVFEALLGGWYIYEGELSFFPNYTGESLTKRWSDESWPYFAYALVNLIGYAPKDTKVDKSIKLSNIKRLDFKNNHFSKLPSVLSKFTNLTHLDLGSCRGLQDIDVLAKHLDLTYLNLSWCYNLKNLDGLSNCTNLTSLHLDHLNIQNVNFLTNLTKLTHLSLFECSDLQNVDGLINCINLSYLFLRDCRSLQNVDGLTNCTKLTSLNLYMCMGLRNVYGLANLPNLENLDTMWSGITPKPYTDHLRNREEIAAYQEEIKKSMK